MQEMTRTLRNVRTIRVLIFADFGICLSSEKCLSASPKYLKLCQYCKEKIQFRTGISWGFKKSFSHITHHVGTIFFFMPPTQIKGPIFQSHRNKLQIIIYTTAIQTILTSAWNFYWKNVIQVISFTSFFFLTQIYQNGLIAQRFWQITIQ